VVLNSIAFAQAGTPKNPFIGTWKLDLSRTPVDALVRAGLPIPNAQTQEYRQRPDGRMEMIVSRVVDGKLVRLTFRWPTAGGLIEEDAAAGHSSIATVIAPDDIYVTSLVNGKQTAAMHKAVSADGKTMTQTVITVDPQGTQVEATMIWARQ
jgi:hypothetical protein